jgi:hypothetical protein
MSACCSSTAAIVLLSSAAPVADEGFKRRIRYRVVIHGEWLIHFIRIFIGF